MKRTALYMVSLMRTLMATVATAVDKQRGDDMQLSEHFSLSEFIKSQTALRKGIRNNPGPRQIEAMRALCTNVLEPARAHFGKPIKISSGYRSPALNRAIGGSSSSDHCKGRAADFEISGVPNYELARWIEDNCNYRQLILEFYTPGEPNSGWVHCAYAGPPFKNQELTAVKRRGRTQYLSGLIE